MIRHCSKSKCSLWNSGKCGFREHTVINLSNGEKWERDECHRYDSKFNKYRQK